MQYFVVSLGMILIKHTCLYDPFNVFCIPAGTPCSRRTIYCKHPVLFLLLADPSLPITHLHFANGKLHNSIYMQAITKNDVLSGSSRKGLLKAFPQNINKPTINKYLNKYLYMEK